MGGIALDAFARSQLHRGGSVQVDAPDGPLLVRAAVGSEQDGLAVGCGPVERHAFLRFEQAPRRRSGPRRVRDVQLWQPVAIGDDHHLLAVAGEERLGVQESVHQRPRLPGKLRDAHGRGPGGRIGEDQRGSGLVRRWSGLR